MFVFRFSWAVLALLLVSVWAEELKEVGLLDTHRTSETFQQLHLFIFISYSYLPLHFCHLKEETSVELSESLPVSVLLERANRNRGKTVDSQHALLESASSLTYCFPIG